MKVLITLSDLLKGTEYNFLLQLYKWTLLDHLQFLWGYCLSWIQVKHYDVYFRMGVCNHLIIALSILLRKCVSLDGEQTAPYPEGREPLAGVPHTDREPPVDPPLGHVQHLLLGGLLGDDHRGGV